VHADLAWALPLEKPPGEAAPRGSLVVGLNPFPYQDSRYWPGGERSRYEAYLDAIASLAQGLRENGHTVVLFPTQLRSDPLVIRDITARLAAWNSRGLPVPLEQPTIETLSDLIATLRSLDLIVSGRFHGVLLGLRLGKPVVALSYQPKTVELMRSVGQSAFVVPMAGIDPVTLTERVSALERDRTAIAAQIESESRRCQQVLERQFDALFNYGPNTSAARSG
jgi:colanic acid/amylovoran biosynthesis protein